MNNNLTHTKACLSHAMICAVENLRDADGQTDITFRVAVQDGEVLREADSYLSVRGDGSICKCYVEAAFSVQLRYVNEGVAAAQSLAQAHLDNHTITLQDYLELVKWTEGRHSYFGTMGA